MSGLDDLLGSRSSFALAAFTVSWIAVVLLALVAANLHFRLAHLERSLPTREARTPYGHLIGRPLLDLLGPEAPPAARLALILASECKSCDRVIAELSRSGRPAPVVLLWRDATPSPPPALPNGVTILADGPRIALALGVGVSPFALAADDGGRVVRAAPAASVEALTALLGDDGSSGTPDRSSPPLTRPTLKGVS